MQCAARDCQNEFVSNRTWKRFCSTACQELTSSRRYKAKHKNPLRTRHSTKNMGRPLFEFEDRGYKTPCYIWKRHVCKKSGYGGVRRNSRRMAAHTWIYEMANGSVPDGLELDHLCRVRECVRPDHLEPVTSRINTRRGAATRFTPEQIMEIRTRRLAGEGPTHLGRVFGTNRAYITNICKRRSWNDLGI